LQYPEKNGKNMWNKDKNDWLKIWETGDTKFHSAKITPELIKYLPKTRIKPGECVLVPLCGKSKDMFWLAEQGYQVIGVELSSKACEEFFIDHGLQPQITKEKRFIKYHYQNITLLCGDFFDLKNEDIPDIKLIYDWKALIALPPKIQKKYVAHLMHCVDNQADMLLLSIDSPDKINGAPYPITPQEINKLFSHYFMIQLLENKVIAELAEHLIELGYRKASATIYLLSRQ